MTRTVQGRSRSRLATLSAGVLFLWPAAALALAGPAHEQIAIETVEAFRMGSQPFLAPPNLAPVPFVQRDSPTPFFPELDNISVHTVNGYEPGQGDLVEVDNGTIIWWNSTSPDTWEPIDWTSWGCGFTVPDVTMRHFWDADIGGALGMTAGSARPSGLLVVPPTLPPAEGAMCPDPLGNGDLYPNAWMKARIHWQSALNLWRVTDEEAQQIYGDLRQWRGWTFGHLGHLVHMMLDVAQPAHVHEDMHRESDSYELWFDGDMPKVFYSWFIRDHGANAGRVDPEDGQRHYARGAPGKIPRPGDFLYPPDTASICNVILNTQFEGSSVRYWDPITLGNDPAIVEDCANGGRDGIARLFYLFYVVNQIADYYASDEYDGDTSEPTGWIDYSSFPGVTTTGDLSDNWWPASNWDGDFTRIITGLSREQFAAGEVGHYGAYQAAFIATHAMLDLFREVIDGVPPSTLFSYARQDGLDYVPGGWNTSRVTVEVEGAEEAGNGVTRPSGLAAILGRCEGVDHHRGGSWLLDDGKHVVQGLSYDMSGAVDRTDVNVWVDRTPPVITFVDQAPFYLTSGTWVPRWNAEDATSGMGSSWAFLDGQPVARDQPVPLALLAGFHTFTVHARDVAGNESWKEHAFEVAIDALAWPKPPEANAKSNGSVMCFVQFPAPYDVMRIDVTTTRLVVGGIPEPALGISPAMDGNKDGRPDRMTRFDAVALAGGVPGSVATATVLGRLAGGELAPRFTGQCPIPLLPTGR